MADPVIGKLGSLAIRNTGMEGNPAVEKQGPSKFDAVKDVAKAEKAEASTLPSAVEKISEPEKKQLVSEVRQRMETNPASSPREVYGPDMTQRSQQIGELRKKVDKLPKNEFSNNVTARLDQIDSQFRKAGEMLDKVTTMNDPRGLLQLQMQLYQVTQNVEIVSKAVEQVNSGVKQVLQTQL